MNADQLRSLLHAVQKGDLDLESALERLQNLPFSDLGYARVDRHRALRLGVPEVILGEQKSEEQIVGIVSDLIEAGQNVLVTRVDEHKARVIMKSVPALSYKPVARVLRHQTHAGRPVVQESVLVVTAGTSDIPIAEEAAETLASVNIPVKRLFDAGVAGIHRLMADERALRTAPVVIVVAGMEGALPSVVGGLVGVPIIAVPTSVGYGASLSGFTALFGMLTGCAAGVTVVNIDNGFGAAMAAWRILRERVEKKPSQNGETR